MENFDRERVEKKRLTEERRLEKARRQVVSRQQRGNCTEYLDRLRFGTSVDGTTRMHDVGGGSLKGNKK